MSHLRSAADCLTFTETLADEAHRDDLLLEELTSEEEFPGIGEMIQQILTAGDGE